MRSTGTSWDALGLIQLIHSSPVDQDISSAIVRFCSRFGITNILGGYMPRIGSSATEQLGGVFCSYWPEEWGQRYFAKGYVFSDPTIRRINRVPNPFTWYDVVDEVEHKSRSYTIMKEANEFGLKSGITIPIVLSNNRRAGFSFAGEDLDISDQNIGILSVIAHSVFQRASVRTVSDTKVDHKLTQRQTDILRWAAEGKTDWEISSILNLSRHTVDKHMRAIRERLQVTSKSQAVAIAIKRRLIRI